MSGLDHFPFAPPLELAAVKYVVSLEALYRCVLFEQLNLRKYLRVTKGVAFVDSRAWQSITTGLQYSRKPSLILWCFPYHCPFDG